MQQIKNLFSDRVFEQPKVKVNSPHNEQINAVMELMGEDIHDSKRYGYWCGRLRRFKSNPNGIYLLIKQAKQGKNPRALFNYLLSK